MAKSTANATCCARYFIYMAILTGACDVGNQNTNLAYNAIILNPSGFCVPLPRFLVCALQLAVLFQNLFQIRITCFLYQGPDANRFWALCDSICGHKGAKSDFLVGTLET